MAGKAKDHNAFLERYKEAADEVDKTLLQEWGSDLDSLLFFAGLFSAVVTAFIVESYKLLQPDYTRLTYYAVRNAPAPYTPESFTVPSSARVVNGLWITSLTLSLLSALVIIMARQCLMNYAVLNRGSLYDWVMLRQYHFDGSTRWHLTEFFALLPVLLHLALFLFLVGLVVFFYGIEPLTARLTLGLVVTVAVLYLAALCIPFFSHDSPFRTTLSITARDTYFTVVDALLAVQRSRDDPWHRIPPFMEPQCFEAALNWFSAWTDSHADMVTIIDALDYNGANITIEPNTRLELEIYTFVDHALERACSSPYTEEDCFLACLRVGLTHLASEKMQTLLKEHEVPIILYTAAASDLELAATLLSEVASTINSLRGRSGGVVPLLRTLKCVAGMSNTMYTPDDATLGGVCVALLVDGRHDLLLLLRMFSAIFSLRTIDPSDACWLTFARRINASLTDEVRRALEQKAGYNALMGKLNDYYADVGFNPDPPTPPQTPQPMPMPVLPPTPSHHPSNAVP
ncbi:hypothetical protein EXIGLDRAFT_720418 [Exidia glandulosa HHB12029]|uniref:DUF6535 domain-containing protein n=1 Tax=Exidia glandulosa HHB12029 TaxID=1314781 RepID=A0A165NIN2_EXIGL|nr:hypothetical protein EXIGLDRAFT_720418 [Exidia glandulosa HHB12029]